MKLVLLALLQATWTVDPAPVLKIGGIDGDVAFTRVNGVTRLDDGSVMVGDQQTPYALQHYSANGELLKNFARKGLGPGEIDYLSTMWRCGDSLFTQDISAERINVYSIDGTYARTFRFGGPESDTPYRSACNDGGVFVHQGWGNPRVDFREGVFRASASVWLSDAHGAVQVVLGKFPGSERFGHMSEGVGGSRPLPLAKEPTVAIAQNRVYVGTAESFVIRVFDLAGKPIGTLSKDIENPRVTDADIDRLVSNDIALGEKASRAAIRRSYDALPIPKTLPAYDRILVDAGGNVWVRPYPRGATATLRWHVFDASGKAVAVAELPTALEVFEIGNDYVLGRYIDEEDLVPEVRAYALRKGARR